MDDFLDMMSAEDQAQFRAARQQTETLKQKSLARGDYARYLAWFGGHEKLQPFVSIQERLDDKQYWTLLSDVWSNIEVSYPDRFIWIALFESSRPRREYLMRTADRKKLASLPDRIPLFRGYAGGRARGGISWTLSEERAIFFASTYARGGRRAMFGFDASARPAMLARGWCHKRDVWAYYNDRKEEEIVINPAKVFSVRAKRA